MLRNDQALGNHWLRVKLTGKAANRDGVGAMLKLKSGETTQWRLVTAARSYLSQSETVATFGLGQGAKQAELTVVWPGGERSAEVGGLSEKLRKTPLSEALKNREVEKHHC